METAREAGPAELYIRRKAEREARVARLRVQERNFSWARLAVFIAGAVLAWPALFSEAGPHAGWLALPATLFVAILWVHERVVRLRVKAERAVEFYRRGIDRLEGRWHGFGADGSAFVDADHPYASDLDIFGPGSLFQLLCTARTSEGERRLAGWLSTPATPDEVRERQAAVRELSDALDLREDLAVLGDDVRGAVDPAGLVGWSRAPARLTALWPSFVAPILGVANIAAVVLYFLDQPLPLLFVVPLSVVFVLAFRARAHTVLVESDRPERGLVTLSEILGRLERERFTTRKLVCLRAALDIEGDPPSVRIGQLARLAEINDSRRNMIFAPIAGLFLLGTQLAFAMERWRARSGPAVARWLDAVAEFEALSSLAGFAYEQPGYRFPEIADAGPFLDGTRLAHPLLPADTAVPNDVQFGDGLQLLLVSGSNMSGKSTMLRTVGVNVVLAFAGAPVRAERLVVSPLTIGACMRVQDSLQAGLSHFYAEIKRLRRIVDLAGGERPLLFLLDEILHGTNSHDRRVGADALIRGLVGAGAIGMVTTHDLALTRIAEEMGEHARNVHFEDHLEGDRMIFDYRIRPGVVEKSNALDLMRAVGLRV